MNLQSTWEKHTASWTTPINSSETNQGVITVHYPSSNLDQKIKVYVNVIPKTSAVDGQNFFTNGKKYDGTNGSIANGANQGSILTKADGQAIDYTAYSGEKTPGEQTVYTKNATSYSPTYSLSGLKTNSDGSLVSGVQTATVRVSVPKGTIGAQVDADGNYYYEVNAKVNIAQPVTFEFVDDDNQDSVVGTPQSQEFIKGEAAITPNLVIPTNYELASGQTLPTTYTLSDYSSTNPVVQIHLKHKTEDITNTDPDAQQTRTVTVNYLVANDGTVDGVSYKKGDKIAESAVLDVYYTRVATKDLITGKVTYGPWQWNTKKGDTKTPGYHVVSGNWTSLPESWANIVADVPTENGFTVDTQGDGTNANKVPANEFVFPTYDGNRTTIAGTNSIAYTDQASNCL